MVEIDQKFALSTPTGLGGNFPLKHDAPKGKHVCFVDNGNQYTELFRQGVKQATTALGWRLTVIQADQNVASSYGSAVTSSAQAGCDGVIMPSAQYANYQSQVPGAAKRGMVIVDANSSNKVGKGVVKVLSASKLQYYEGAATANVVLKHMAEHHPKGDVTIQTVMVPQFENVFKPILDGFKRQIAVGCGARCKVYTVNDDLSVATGPNPSAPFVAALQRNPETDYMIQSGVTDSGLVAALQQAGLKVPAIIGTAPLQSQLRDLQSSHPTTVAWVAQPFITYGWFMVDGLVRYWADDKPYDPWAHLPDVKWALYPSNVKDFVDGGQSAFPKGYQQLFESMWKI
ncbi:substrate-binding domain-containing protein [Streptomyces sp. NPDC091219]|uniref:substrate-binding domain-containing protein n=1 Tax=Streptomyces sp. NPDC091219 TaxID=3155193 RepID=UPI003450F300